MKKIILLLAFGLVGCGDVETADQKNLIPDLPSNPDLHVVSTIPPSQTPNALPLGVSATHSHTSYGIANAMDASNSTFWTTHELSKNDSITVFINFGSAMSLGGLTLKNDYSHVYSYGDLGVFYSSDGINWLYHSAHIYGALSASHLDIDGPINAQYVALVMTYTGTGAYGSSPSFYISEIETF